MNFKLYSLEISSSRVLIHRWKPKWEVLLPPRRRTTRATKAPTKFPSSVKRVRSRKRASRKMAFPMLATSRSPTNRTLGSGAMASHRPCNHHLRLVPDSATTIASTATLDSKLSLWSSSWRWYTTKVVLDSSLNTSRFGQDHRKGLLTIPSTNLTNWQINIQFVNLYFFCRLKSNHIKNRYSDVLCCDHSRVCLSQIDGDPSSDYINANFVDGYKQKNAFISTQGPLPKTCNDFWRMVWEQQTLVIVMTTRYLFLTITPRIDNTCVNE